MSRNHYKVEDELDELRAKTGKTPAPDHDHDRSGTVLMWVLVAVLAGIVPVGALLYYVIGD